MKNFEIYLKETGEVGYVQSIVSSIFYVSGLPGARLNELVLTENGLLGIVKSILPDLVEVMVFEGHGLTHSMKVVRTNEYFQVPVTQAYLGRVIDPFGVPQDSLMPIGGRKVNLAVDPGAPGVMDRVTISRPMETGVMAVDMQVPVGLGQRELILGDQKTGKTSFALLAMAHAIKNGMIGVYVSIGKKKSDVKYVQEFFASVDVLGKIAIVVATSADPAPMVYLAPFSGMSIAEFFRDKGIDVLVVMDDLTTHAKFYREIALLSRRPPGRQSYPGDIFHLHARLMERAGNIKGANGRGEISITLLPIAETVEGDLAGYIQTNLMAMTDGHIFFDVNESKRGRHPSVSFQLSVSRVGNQTRTYLERELAQQITLGLNEYRKAEELGRFGVELTEQTIRVIHTYERLEELLNQENDEILPRDLQTILLGLFFAGAFEPVETKKVRDVKKRICQEFEQGKYDNFRLKLKNCKNFVDLVKLTQANLTRFGLGHSSANVAGESMIIQDREPAAPIKSSQAAV